MQHEGTNVCPKNICTFLLHMILVKLVMASIGNMRWCDHLFVNTKKCTCLTIIFFIPPPPPPKKKVKKNKNKNDQEWPTTLSSNWLILVTHKFSLVQANFLF